VAVVDDVEHVPREVDCRIEGRVLLVVLVIGYSSSSSLLIWRCCERCGWAGRGLGVGVVGGYEEQRNLMVMMWNKWESAKMAPANPPFET
jgi:hypothetical protein